jgi:hypothetical protein
MTVTKIVDGQIAALYGRKLVLVRPDGHVAWRGDMLDRDAGAIMDVVRGADVARVGHRQEQKLFRRRTTARDNIEDSGL